MTCSLLVATSNGASSLDGALPIATGFSRLPFAQGLEVVT
jgi:hypothetical protein